MDWALWNLETKQIWLLYFVTITKSWPTAICQRWGILEGTVLLGGEFIVLHQVGKWAEAALLRHDQTGPGSENDHPDFRAAVMKHEWRKQAWLRAPFGKDVQWEYVLGTSKIPVSVKKPQAQRIWWLDSTCFRISSSVLVLATSAFHPVTLCLLSRHPLRAFSQRLNQSSSCLCAGLYKSILVAIAAVKSKGTDT